MNKIRAKKKELSNMKHDSKYSLLESDTCILDGSNIAFHNYHLNGKKPLFRNIILIEQQILQSYPKIKILIICDANLRYLLEDSQIFVQYVKSNKLFEVPARTDADFFILKYVLRHPNALIISNDQYKEYNGPFEKIKRRRIPFLIITDEVYLYCLEDQENVNDRKN